MVVSSIPRLMPSSRNWTPATATLSEADAATVMEPRTVSPGAGDVIETVGGLGSLKTATLSEAEAATVTGPETVRPETGDVMETVGAVVSLKTVTVICAEVARLPAASRATAVRVWEPLPALVVFQGTA